MPPVHRSWLPAPKAVRLPRASTPGRPNPMPPCYRYKSFESLNPVTLAIDNVKQKREHGSYSMALIFGLAMFTPTYRGAWE